MQRMANQRGRTLQRKTLPGDRQGSRREIGERQVGALGGLPMVCD